MQDKTNNKVKLNEIFIEKILLFQMKYLLMEVSEHIYPDKADRFCDKLQSR